MFRTILLCILMFAGSGNLLAQSLEVVPCAENLAVPGAEKSLCNLAEFSSDQNTSENEPRKLHADVKHTYSYLLQNSEKAEISPNSIIPFSNADALLWSGMASRAIGMENADLLLNNFDDKSGFMNAISTQPGYGFFASLLVPGISQAANNQYWKTGIMLAVEAASIYFIIDGNQRGRRLEREYIRDGDKNWSVVQYAAWIHEYYHTVPNARDAGAPDIALQSLLTEAGMNHVAQTGTHFPSPQFGNTPSEWEWINLPALRELERSTSYLRADGSQGNKFSHDVPDFGSQQYYELMSKYWQFGPGWFDWNPFFNNSFEAQVAAVNAARNDAMTPMWLAHTRLETRFNDAYRFSSNMLNLLIANHVFSAFDAYFTIKLRNHRLESEMFFTPYGGQYTLTWHF